MAGCSGSEREPHPAIHLVAGLAEGPGRLAPRDQLATRLMKRPTTCATPGSSGGSTKASPPPRSPPGPVTPSRCFMRVYARCVTGLEGVWIGSMDEALDLEEDQ